MSVENELFRKYFYLSQIGIGVLFVGIAWFLLKGKPSDSGFKVREADRTDLGTGGKSDLANAKIKISPRLLLPGVRLEGSPHEILGVHAQATPEAIQKAYRDLMKIYHPDRVAPAGSEAWKEAQKIAGILNRAKDELLKSKKS